MSGNGSQNAAAKSAEKGFSENELDDIMAEFASLDAELTTSGPLAEEVKAEAEVEEPVAQEGPEEVNPLDELEAASEAHIEEEEVHVEDFPSAEEFEEVSAEAAPVAQEAPEETQETQIISETDLMEASSEADEEPSSAPTIEQAFGEGFDEAEMDAIMKDLEDIDASAGPTLEMEEEIEPEAQTQEENVVAMKKPEPTPVAAPAAQAGDVAFSAAGNMNFNVNLTIAGSEATLSVQDGCFKLTMNGVDISITEEGCKAFIEGGVNFNIPLPSDKKDVA